MFSWAMPSQTTYLPDWPLGVGGFQWGDGALGYDWLANEGVVFSGDVVINYKKNLRLSAGERTSLYLHEVGHAVGLDHTYDSRQVMHQGLSRRSPTRYQYWDKYALGKISRRAGCESVPSKVARPTLSLVEDNLHITVPKTVSLPAAKYQLQVDNTLVGAETATPVWDVPYAQFLTGDFSVWSQIKVLSSNRVATRSSPAVEALKPPIDLIGEPSLDADIFDAHVVTVNLYGYYASYRGANADASNDDIHVAGDLTLTPC